MPSARSRAVEDEEDGLLLGQRGALSFATSSNNKASSFVSNSKRATPVGSTQDLLHVDDMELDMEELQLHMHGQARSGTAFIRPAYPAKSGMTSANGAEDGDTSYEQETWTGTFWKIVMYIMVIGFWKFVRGLAWILSKWQVLFKPISLAVYYTLDFMDRHMPTVRTLVVWFWNFVSLSFHFISVLFTFGTIGILYRNSHRWYALLIAFLYLLSHYLMAVIMFMEMDRVTSSSHYTGSDFYNFVARLVHVLFWDMQMFASLIHSNIMIEGLTQMQLKGYEEARVCVHALVNTIPACVILGLLYDMQVQWIRFEDIDIRSYRVQVYLALLFSVFNATEKWLRFSLADPWMYHSSDGYPLLYMRSNAARLPYGLILDWLFRCNKQLVEQEDELILRDVFSHYTFNCKGDVRELCDGHKAHLIKKALRTFNGTNKYNKAEALARRFDKSKFRHTRSIKTFNASGIKPGLQMSTMLAEILADTHGIDAFMAARNDMGDASTAQVVEGMKNNDHFLNELKHMDLANNNIGITGCEAIAGYVAHSKALTHLNLSHNPIRDAGIKALCDALVTNMMLWRLDLSHCTIGPEGGAALGAMLKSNKGLRELILNNTSLGSSGISSIAKGLTVNQSLCELDVSMSGADDRAAVGLAQALLSNRTLIRINLSQSRIGDHGAKAICDALQQNNVLQVCDLSNTTVDKSWIKLLQNIITGRSRGQ